MQLEQTVAEVIGDLDLSRRVVAEILRQHGGDRIYLPADHYRYRNEQIVELVESGVAVERVSRRFGLCERTVRRIVKNCGSQR